MLLFHEQAHNTETDGETEKTQQNTDRMPLSRTHKTAGVAKNIRLVHSLIHCGLQS